MNSNKVWPTARGSNRRIATSTIFSIALVLSVLPATGEAQRLYWTQNGPPFLVGSVNLDGTGAVTSAQTNRPLGIDTSDSMRRIYWIDDTAKTIVRADENFGNVTTIVSGLTGSFHLNLAIEEAANLVFWTDGNASVWRAPLSGGPLIGNFHIGFGNLDDITVDATHQKLYFVSQVTPEVYRANYDGSAFTTLIDLGDGVFDAASGIDLDLANEKIYVAIANGSKILRANLDGTNLESVVNLSHRPFGMEIFQGRLYWADLDGGKLFSAKLDGSDVTTLLSGLSQPRQVSVMAIPEPSTLVSLIFGLPASLVSSLRRRAD